MSPSTVLLGLPSVRPGFSTKLRMLEPCLAHYIAHLLAHRRAEGWAQPQQWAVCTSLLSLCGIVSTAEATKRCAGTFAFVACSFLYTPALCKTAHSFLTGNVSIIPTFPCKGGRLPHIWRQHLKRLHAAVPSSKFSAQWWANKHSCPRLILKKKKRRKKRLL